ncbi:MAG: 3-isopropylmalate dehydratase [Desulfosporosinus sp. BRH_c37]|nr:MAG: 3-isopropylmalate dehydratase [Desulfosporosinus sp. BRH_c37]
MIEGSVWKFGRDIDTDVIIAGRYCNLTDPVELCKHVFEDLDSTFAGRFRPGDVLVADANFGCGSSREVAPFVLKAAGVAAVVAPYFARIFYRNAINIGLPIFEIPGITQEFAEGQQIRVDPATGRVINITTGQTYQAAPFPEFMEKIMAVGGLVNYASERLGGAVNG